ncbi:extra-large guanine nucleotide-binding protein 1 isoform X2 [Ricinus communis]|uniref:GTP-binding protein alpha subunit, gna, putative n=1 Tax=Ricinus communis TaxID=3988 RepID=B9RZF5_RICCO|nr:extra-large guanine nucleotide-binding protein 1 isoform X2 [Ricinus communis]EEF43335.1 GTP-binding protein alpha subunit, gna, putative [Ricinus communis]|eukprot:XP_015574549.1 extra-large guanine nucleotide-binding protein 1 isoform X2 [Ricinus communis]
MSSLLRKILPVVPSSTPKEDDESNYESSYSFAALYSGPLITHEIPRAVPVDVTQIPIASKIASSSKVNDVPLPVIQPILKSKSSGKKPPKVPRLGKSNDEHCKSSNGIAESSKVGYGNGDECRPNLSNGRGSSREMEDAIGDECRSNLSDTVQSSGNVRDSSHEVSGHLQVLEVREDNEEDSGRDFQDYMNPTNCESMESDLSSHSISSEIFSGKEDDCIGEAPSHVRRPSVTFLDPESSNVLQEDSDISAVESEIPARPMALRPGKKGACYRCLKGNRLTEKEICIVCGAKYCFKCLLKAMGSMPEGRKCVTCIGLKIDESKRKDLGKCSRMLKQLLPKLEVKQIMNSERSCEVNKLPPELVYVNGERLSQEELFMLQTCPYPPKKLKPGNYWYDKVSGFWGKEGQKPCQIISPQLTIGGHIKRDASNGNTNIMINNREITKVELLMLQLVGVKCEGTNHFWVDADGSYQEEGMNNVKGRIWEKNTAKLICAALSLPTPPASARASGGEENSVLPPGLRQKTLYKLLLVGYEKSGTSTVFKQAKIVYRIPFSEEERQNIKMMIQSHLYGYLGILLEGREQFEEQSLIRKKRHVIDQCSSSDNAGQINNRTTYDISPKLKGFSDWLLNVILSGNLETIFPASTREYAPFVEELWNDAAFQATYSRRNELELLPRAASYFLERAVEISKPEYEPTNMDILYTEGITSSKGLSSMEFSFPIPAQDSCEHNEHDPSMRYQLIRVHPNVLGGNCKWLEMFEDVDMVLFCVSLIDYDEYVKDSNGVAINKMMASKQLFESIVTNPMFEKKKFLLVLNKFDLLEEKIEQVPLTRCEWFHDFDPIIGHNRNSCSSSSIIRATNPSLAHRAFQYIAFKFKRLFTLLTDNKLFASVVTALEPDNVDEALRYAREILHWEHEEPVEYSSSSNEASSTS